jgi:hypothetical protein
MKPKVILWFLSEHENIFLDIVWSDLVFLNKLEIGCDAFLPFWERSQHILLVKYYENQPLNCTY